MWRGEKRQNVQRGSVIADGGLYFNTLHALFIAMIFKASG